MNRFNQYLEAVQDNEYSDEKLKDYLNDVGEGDLRVLVSEYLDDAEDLINKSTRSQTMINLLVTKLDQKDKEKLLKRVMT